MTESTELLSIEVSKIFLESGLQDGFAKVARSKNLRKGFARLLVTLGFLEGKNFGLFKKFSNSYPREAAIVMFYFIDPSVLTKDLDDPRSIKMVEKVAEKLKNSLVRDKEDDLGLLPEDIGEELGDILKLYNIHTRERKFRQVLDSPVVDYGRIQPLLAKDILRDTAMASTRVIFSGFQPQLIEFFQNGNLQILCGPAFSHQETFELCIDEMDVSRLPASSILQNLSLVTASQILKFLISNNLSNDEHELLVQNFEEKILSSPIAVSNSIILDFEGEIETEIPEAYLRQPISSIFKKISNDVAPDFGVKLSALGGNRLLDFVIDGLEKGLSPKRLALLLPKRLRSKFMDRTGSKFDSGESIESEIHFLQCLFLDDTDGLTEAYSLLSKKVEFDDNQWFFEAMERDLEIISYEKFETLGKVILDIHERICIDFMNVGKGKRSLAQKLCLKIEDQSMSISVTDLSWMTTCALPRTCLPSSVFALCNSVDGLYPVDFKTDLPISCLLLAIGFGANLDLDKALLDPKVAEKNSRSGFSGAISVALVQLLPVLEQEEVKRVAKFLGRVVNGIVCPFGKAEDGFSALLSVISYSMDLLRNKEVVDWKSAEQAEVLKENVNLILAPVVDEVKKKENWALFESLVKFCCHHHLKDLIIPISSTAQSWGDVEAKKGIFSNVKKIFPEEAANLCACYS